MLRIGICEDNKDFVKELKASIEKKFFNNDIDYKIDCFYSGEDIINHILNYEIEYDIIFFDIELSALDGIETARRIRESHKETIFIFVSYLTDRVFEALDLTIFQFIRKDHFEKEIDKVLDSLIQKYDYLTGKYSFPVGDEILYLRLSNILYLEALDRHVVVHTKKETYITNYRTMAQVPVDHISKGFFEIYKGIMVNLNHIESLVENQITLSNKDVLYVSRRKLNSFKEAFYKHIADR